MASVAGESSSGDVLSALEIDDYMGVWTDANDRYVRVLEPDLDRQSQWNHVVLQRVKGDDDEAEEQHADVRQSEANSNDQKSGPDSSDMELRKMVESSFHTVSQGDMKDHWEYIKARYRFHTPTKDPWNSNYNEGVFVRWRAWWDMVNGSNMGKAIDVHLRKHYDWISGEEHRQAWMTFVHQTQENASQNDADSSENQIGTVVLAGLPVEKFLYHAASRIRNVGGVLAHVSMANGLLWSPKESVLKAVKALDMEESVRQSFMNEAAKVASDPTRSIQQQLRTESAFFTSQVFKRHYIRWLMQRHHAEHGKAKISATAAPPNREPFVGVAIVELSVLHIISHHFFTHSEPGLYHTMEHFINE